MKRVHGSLVDINTGDDVASKTTFTNTLNADPGQRNTACRQGP